MAFTNINKSSDYFSTNLYTGNGGNQTITGIGHTPSFVWFKSRDAGNSHALVNSVSGTNKVLYADTNSAEQTISAQTFNSDGFALVQDSGANSINSNGSTKVAWSWKMGTTSGLTGGTITPTSYSLNTVANQSVIAYTGTGSNASIPHGISKPSAIIIKRLDASADWVLYNKGIGATKYLNLNTNSSQATSSGIFNNTEPTSSVFYVGSDGAVNASGGTYIAYCFSNTAGYFSAGKYKGNGNVDGSYIQLNFRPSMVIVKNVEVSNQWQMFDVKRGRNGAMGFSYPDSAEAETATVPMDIYSNGFKFRDGSGARNDTGYDYIYMAWADAPIVGSNNVPCTAR